MTALLLDTHALVWAVTAPERLSEAAREAVQDGGTRLLVSAVSAWEISLKHRSGRWPEVAVLLRQYQRAVDRLRAAPLPLTPEHALLAGGLEWEHGDPFDRALAAQAVLEGVPLVTRDRAFAALPGLQRLW